MLVIWIVCTHHSFIFLGHFDAGEANSLKRISFLQLLYLNLVSPPGLFVSVKSYICTAIMSEFIVIIAGFFLVFCICHYEELSSRRGEITLSTA